MFRITIMFFFLIGTSFQLERLNQFKNNETQNKVFPRKTRVISKRDNCVYNAQTMVAQNSINVGVTALQNLVAFNPSKISLSALTSTFSTFSSISGLAGSIFGLNSDSTCDIHKIVNQILTEVIQISSDIRNLQFSVDGLYIKSFYKDLSRQIETFLSLFKEHAITVHKIEIRNEIKKHCLDTNSGINKLYGDFKFIMRLENVIDFLKNVAEYKTKYINFWMTQITGMAFDLGLIVKGCEEALNQNSNIDLDQFYHVTENNIIYFNNYIEVHFAKNLDSSSGIRNSIKTVANKGMNAHETAKLLKEYYSYFDWTVIFYSDKVRGWGSHTAYTTSGTPYSGSFHFIRELKDRNALVAYTLPSNLKTEDYLKEKMNEDILKGTSAEKVANRLKENINVGYNFVLAVKSGNEVQDVDSYCQAPCYFGRKYSRKGEIGGFFMHGFTQMTVILKNSDYWKLLEYKTFSIIFVDGIIFFRFELT